MDSNELMLAGLLLLAALSIATIVFLLINPYLSGDHRTDKRIQGVTEKRAKRIASKTQVEVASNRRRQVADMLQELDDRQKAGEKVSLRLRLQRAGLAILPRACWLASLVCGVLLGAAIWLTVPKLPIVVPPTGGVRWHLGVTALDLGAHDQATPIQVYPTNWPMPRAVN